MTYLLFILTSKQFNVHYTHTTVLCLNQSDLVLDFLCWHQVPSCCLAYGGPHLMSAVFFKQNSVVRVPEFNSAVVRAAGAKLVLTGLAAEREAWHPLLVSRQTPCRETESDAVNSASAAILVIIIHLVYRAGLESDTVNTASAAILIKLLYTSVLQSWSGVRPC